MDTVIWSRTDESLDSEKLRQYFEDALESAIQDSKLGGYDVKTPGAMDLGTPELDGR